MLLKGPWKHFVDPQSYCRLSQATKEQQIWRVPKTIFDANVRGRNVYIDNMLKRLVFWKGVRSHSYSEL